MAQANPRPGYDQAMTIGVALLLGFNIFKRFQVFIKNFINKT